LTLANKRSAKGVSEDQAPRRLESALFAMRAKETLGDSAQVPGQFVAGQFVADNSSRTIRRRTIRRGQLVAK